MEKAVILHHNDNVATLLSKVQKGETIKVKINDEIVEIEILQDIPFGHKISIKNIKKNEKVIKHGEVIGLASKDILKGFHVHIHNIQSYRSNYLSKK